jgi:hypothetical protein
MLDFKKDASVFYTDAISYDLLNGYIDVSTWLNDEMDIVEVDAAIELLQELIIRAGRKGLIQEY